MTPDQIAEIEHAAALHFEDAETAARDFAAAELGARTVLDGEDDGCLLPARGYTFLAERADERAAVRIAVTPADGGAFVAQITERLTHRVGDIDGAGEAFYGSLEAALEAALAESRKRGGLSVVWEVGSWLAPAALCFDGTTYRPA